MNVDGEKEGTRIQLLRRIRPSAGPMCDGIHDEIYKVDMFVSFFLFLFWRLNLKFSFFSYFFSFLLSSIDCFYFHTVFFLSHSLFSVEIHP